MKPSQKKVILIYIEALLGASLKTEKYYQKNIAKRYGVDRTYVTHIYNKSKYSWITDYVDQKILDKN